MCDLNQHLLVSGDGPGQPLALEAGLTVAGSLTFTLWPLAAAQSSTPQSSSDWLTDSTRTYTLKVAQDGSTATRKAKFWYDACTWVTRWQDPNNPSAPPKYYLYIYLREDGNPIKGDSGSSADTCPAIGYWRSEVTNLVDNTVDGPTEGLYLVRGSARPLAITVWNQALAGPGIPNYTGELDYTATPTTGIATPVTMSYPNLAMAWAYRTWAWTATGTGANAAPTDVATSIANLWQNEEANNEIPMPHNSAIYVGWSMRPRLITVSNTGVIGTNCYLDFRHEPQEQPSVRGIHAIWMQQTVSSPTWNTPWRNTPLTGLGTPFVNLPSSITASSESTPTPSSNTLALTTNALTDDPHGFAITGIVERWEAPAKQ